MTSQWPSTLYLARAPCITPALWGKSGVARPTIHCRRADVYPEIGSKHAKFSANFTKKGYIRCIDFQKLELTFLRCFYPLFLTQLRSVTPRSEARAERGNVSGVAASVAASASNSLSTATVEHPREHFRNLVFQWLRSDFALTLVAKLL